MVRVGDFLSLGDFSKLDSRSALITQNPGAAEPMRFHFCSP